MISALHMITPLELITHHGYSFNQIREPKETSAAIQSRTHG
jgi:hypothetical protein